MKPTARGIGSSARFARSFMIRKNKLDMYAVHQRISRVEGEVEVEAVMQRKTNYLGRCVKFVINPLAFLLYANPTASIMNTI